MVSVHSSASSVQAGGTDLFTALVQGLPATTGRWIVVGGTQNGSIDPSGLFHAPAIVPTPNTVLVGYLVGRRTTTAPVTVTPPVPVVITSAQAAVAAGGTDLFSATQQGVAVTGGQWVVLGGMANGLIDANGLFHAPAAVPNPDTVTVGYISSGKTFTAPITVFSPVPAIVSVVPGVLTKLSTSVGVTGAQFTSGSLILINGTPITTSFIDASHLTGTITLPAPFSSTLQVTVSNPDQSKSQPFAVSASFPQLAVLPAVLTPGTVSLTITGAGFTSGDVVTLNGAPMATTLVSSTSLIATGYLAPWTVGPVTVEVAGSDGLAPIAAQAVPLAPTAVSYDAASRFLTQAAFGPRPGLVEHVQSIGFDAFITEQFQQAPIVFSSTGAKHAYINAAVQGNALLRQRVAFSLQSFIVPQWEDFDPSSTNFEDKMEADATANFRQILTDVAMDPNMAHFLSEGNNFASTDPLQQPNQNFARELMQLFSIGPFLLNDDGSQQLDGQGQPFPAYGQDTVIAMTRALTGWYYPATVNQSQAAWDIDFSQPLSPWNGGHDHGAKTLFSNIVLPAGADIISDRDAALDAIFNHPNLPPFIGHLLIQHLVTSNPSPAYIQRISTIFEDNGKGVRGDMAAVVRGILLDPEARKGDTTPSPNDGFLQEPLLFQMFAMNILQNYGSDDQINDFAAPLGEVLWTAPNVFGYVSPAYMVPGTAVNSPEFGLFTNETVIQRSNMLWGIVSAQQAGYTTNYTQASWLFTTFTTVPAIVEALNHLAYHGQMSPEAKTIIVNAASQVNSFNPTLQLQTAAFLALNADSYNVAH